MLIHGADLSVRKAPNEGVVCRTIPSDVSQRLDISHRKKNIRTVVSRYNSSLQEFIYGRVYLLYLSHTEVTGPSGITNPSRRDYVLERGFRCTANKQDVTLRIVKMTCKGSGSGCTLDIRADIFCRWSS